MRIISIFTFLLSVCLGEKIVKYAAVIYRHGDRTPVNVYPTDPWKNESLWPVRFGELTNTGKRQHYALGRWLKKRYSGLLSEEFDPKEIHIQSTDVDRTLMSAQANLAGMFPPSGKSIWDKDLLWQPIPVHTKPEHDDEVLAMKRKCPPYDRQKTIYMRSVPYKERLKKYQGLMDYLTAYSGKKVKDYEDISEIYNVLYIESLYNFTLPNWTQSVYPNKLREPACYSFTTATATPTMARLMVGPILKEITGKMNIIITKKKPNPYKMSIYSGHDFTIGNLLTAIGVYDGECPMYTSTIFFELLQDNNTMDYFVQMLYRNSTEIVEPHVIEIPHCGRVCPFERFLKLYENLVTVDWNKECKNKKTHFIGIGVVIGIWIIVCIINKLHFARISQKRYIPFAYISVNNPGPVVEKDGNLIIY